MKWLYIDKNKGKFFTIIALLSFSILIIVRIVISILVLIDLIPNVLDLFKIVLFGLTFNFDQLIVLFTFFALYLIIDGFFDGISINLVNISVLFIILFIILNMGRLEFILYIPFSRTSIMLDLSLFLYIIIFTYFGILVFEIYLFLMKLNQEEKKQAELQAKEEKTVSKKGDSKNDDKAEIVKRKPSEKETPLFVRMKKPSKSGREKITGGGPLQGLLSGEDKWVNGKVSTLYFEENEKPLFNEWEEVSGEYKVSFFQFYTLNLLIMLGTGFIYGIIRYFLYDIPAPGNYLNFFLTGCFFPVYAVLLTSFISFRHFLRSLIYIFIIMFATLTFWELNLITIEGTFIFSHIVSFINFIFIDLSPFFNLMTRHELYSLYVFILGIVIQIIFFLLLLSMLIRYIRKRGEKIEIFSSNNYLYIRDEDTKNPWMLLFDVLSVIMWPFNPNKYRSLYNKIKFKILSVKEGMDYIYGRLSYLKSIKRLKTFRYRPRKPIIELICLSILTIFTISYLFGYIFLGIIFIEIYRYYKNRDKYTLKVKYIRKRAQGSIFLNGNANLLYVYRLDEKTADSIPLTKFKGRK